MIRATVKPTHAHAEHANDPNYAPDSVVREDAPVNEIGFLPPGRCSPTVQPALSSAAFSSSGSLPPKEPPGISSSRNKHKSLATEFEFIAAIIPNRAHDPWTVRSNYLNMRFETLLLYCSSTVHT